MAPISSRFLSFALVGLGVITISLVSATAQAASADLAVTIAVPATVPAGSTVTFVATVTNNGPNSAQAVVMTATIPSGVAFFGISDTGSTPFTGGSGPVVGSTTGTIQGTITTLPAGASASAAVSIAFEVPPTTPTGTVISFSGTASSSTSDPNSSNNTGSASTTVTAAVGGTADVAVTMIAPTIAPPGSNARYAVTVTNNGPNDAQSVILTGTTPAGVTYAGASLTSGQKPTGGNVPATGGTGAVLMTFSSLAPGASSTLAFTFQVSSNPSLLGQVISYTMSASSSTADPTPANNTFTASTTIGTPPQLVITSTSPLPACTVGVAYSFQFTAAGGAGGYTWQLLPGNGNGLTPDGLLLSPGGLLSGIPTGGPDSSFVVQVTDGVGMGAQGSFAYHINLTPPLTITTPSPLPAGTVGVAYSLQFTSTGGAGGNTWSMSHGSAGNLSLSPSGLLSGTPMGSGDFGFGVEVTDSASHTTEGSFTLHISPAASNPYATWVPVASHASGLNQSQWRSDLGLFNTGTVTANVQLSFYGSGGVVTNTVYVPAGTQSILTDVVGQIGGSGSGAIQIVSDQSLKVTARTYNQVSSGASCYAGGTQGQDYPTGAASGGLSTGQSAYLAGLTENASYHCNIGVVDVGSGAASVLVELFDGAGSKLTDYTVNLTAGQWSQTTQPFKNLAGQTAMDRGYAKITVQSGSGVFGFASVIDNITNDPTTVAMQLPAAAQFTQQGSKLVGTGAVGAAGQGYGVAMSADGNTAIVGGVGDNSDAGAAWVFTRSGGVWSQQGSKLVGTGAVGAANQGYGVAISADGNTAIIGGWADNSRAGAAWVFTRSGGVWSQQGSKLVGAGAVGSAWQGQSVALSADGNTAIVGGQDDNSFAGAVWVWTRSGGVWSQQGSKLVGSGSVGFNVQLGTSVALSADGNTAIVGGPGDDTAGAAWVYTRSGGVWSQQGSKLVGTGSVGNASQGTSVVVSADGNTAIVGGPTDNSRVGAAWVWTRSGGVWTQQGSKLVGAGAVGSAWQGQSVAISADGNTAIVGGFSDNSKAGAVWVWTRSGGVWTQQGSKLVGTGAVGAAEQGWSVATSADGTTAIVGGYTDNSSAGAAWVFSVPAFAVWVPVASHNAGLNQSQWRSDLGLLNTGTVTANVHLSFYGSVPFVVGPFLVPAGTQSILTDVVGQIGGSGSGAIQIVSEQPLQVTARSYNQVSSSASCYAGGTQGQDYPAGTTSGGLSAGQSAYLTGLTENASYHCNIGVVNVGSSSATVIVDLFDAVGTALANYTVSLAAGQWAQATQPFKNAAGQTAMDRGYARITVQSGSGVFGFASVIDNITNDPTTVAMQR